MMKRILNHIRKQLSYQLDYIRCSTSKVGSYKAYYIEQEVLAIRERQQVNVYLHPVLFDLDDSIDGFPNAVVPEETIEDNLGIVEMPLKGAVAFDPQRDVLFVLAARLFGGEKGNEEMSKKDIFINHRNHQDAVYDFLRKHILTSKNVRIGCIRVKPYVSYKDIAKK